jgi:hypothetical protein
VIEVRGRKFRDHMDLYNTFMLEQYQAEREAAPVTEEQPSEEALLFREQIEALDKAHEAISPQQQFESGAKIFGEKTMRDWEILPNQ